MTVILHKTLPEDMRAERGMPGIAPVQGAWLRCDDAYNAQMARRVDLLDNQRAEVLYSPDPIESVAQELLALVLDELPGLGFARQGDRITCPDGRSVELGSIPALEVLGRLVQCDFCLLSKRGDEHVLDGAVLCFPASWRLAEKVGRPLTTIHDPVQEYDPEIARRVQRLFDGVKAGRPLWRFNRLWYADAELYQPRSVIEPRRIEQGPAQSAYYRSERQTILRLPVSGSCVFAIHTYVLHRSAIT